MLDLLKHSTECLLIIAISLCFFIIRCAHYSKYTIKIGIFGKFLLIIIFQLLKHCWEWHQIWQQWLLLLLGMAPDLKAVVLLRNVLAFCRSIMCNIRFCEELKVRFCMHVKIISNAKYGKINPMSYLSDEIFNIWDSCCGDDTDSSLSYAALQMLELGSSLEKEVKQYQTASHHIPDNSRIWGTGNMCSPHLAVLFCFNTGKWQWP